MVDEPHDNDSEYQFNDDQEELNYQYEEQSSATDAKSASGAPATKGKRRPILLLIGAVVIVFIIYKVIEALFGGGATKVAQKKVTVKKTSAMKFEKPKPFTAAVTKTTAVTALPQTTQMKPLTDTAAKKEIAALSAAKPAEAKAVSKLEMQGKSLARKIEQQQFENQANLMAVQESLKTMTNKFDKLLTTVNTLVVTTKQNQKAAEQLRHEKASQAKRRQAEIRATKAYFVSAIVPGRAWLKGKDGTTATVAVGETLPGYGKVVKINSYSGTVTTVHGIIQYGSS